MAAMRRILTLISVGAICLLVACGSSSSHTTTQTAVTITVTPPATTSIPAANTTGLTFTAIVTNDPGNYGVDWAITCPSTFPAGCGTLNIPSMHSASPSTVTYLPPADFAAGTLTVNVTAFATADHTQNQTTALTITSYANVLNGGTPANYVLQVQGSDSNGAPYQIAGVFTFDSNPTDASYGTITAGEQTLNTMSGFSASYNVQQGSGSLPSTYFVGPDGRGSITLNVQPISSSGNPIQETFSLVVISSSKALIAELDSNSAAGTLELQTAAALTLPASYAFVASGVDSGQNLLADKNGPMPIAFGGVLNIDSSGDISLAGSVADEDYNKELISCPANNAITGSVLQADSFGRVLIDLIGQSSCLDSNGNPATFDPTQLYGYIVDANHIRLVENDDLDGTSGFLTGGLAIAQGSTAGTFTNASFSGPFVFGILGANIPTTSTGTLVPSSLTSAGVVTADGSGGLSGYTDTFLQFDSAGSPAQVSSPFSNGNYQTDALGRVAWTNLVFNVGSFKPDFITYLNGDGTPLVLYGETNGSYGSVGAGIAYPQAAPPLAFGNPENYGVSFTLQNGGEDDGTGQMTSSYNGTTIVLNGAADDLDGNEFPGSGTPITLSETFAQQENIAGAIMGTFLSGNGGGYVNYYLVDDNHGFLIETDLTTSSQVALGYFAQTCDVTSATACQTAAARSSRRQASKGRGSRRLRNNSATPWH